MSTTPPPPVLVAIYRRTGGYLGGHDMTFDAVEGWCSDVQDALFKRAKHFADAFWEEHYQKRPQSDR